MSWRNAGVAAERSVVVWYTNKKEPKCRGQEVPSRSACVVRDAWDGEENVNGVR